MVSPSQTAEGDIGLLMSMCKPIRPSGILFICPSLIAFKLNSTEVNQILSICRPKEDTSLALNYCFPATFAMVTYKRFNGL